MSDIFEMLDDLKKVFLDCFLYIKNNNSDILAKEALLLKMTFMNLMAKIELFGEKFSNFDATVLVFIGCVIFSQFNILKTVN